MENYLEQVVANTTQSRKTLYYFLLCMLMVILMMWALICLAGALTGDSGINWIGLAGFVVFGGLAAIIFRFKDYLRIEYEYVYSDGKLDVSSVMNNRRRRYLTRLELSQVKNCGVAKGPAYEKASADPSWQKHKWYLDGKQPIFYFCIEKKGAKHMMLLQLNNDMVELIVKGKRLPMGVWHDAEGKTSIYGSLS